MSKDTSPEDPPESVARILRCVEDLDVRLASCRARYDRHVITAALAKQIGTALRVLVHDEVITPQQARKVIERIRSNALREREADKDDPREGSGSGPSPSLSK